MGAPGFAMQALIGDFGQPLPRLAVHIVQIGELAQRPEVLADVSDAAAFHFSFFPAAGRIAGPRVKVVFAGEGQEARIEAHQAAIMFGDGGGQIVIGDLSATPPKLRESVNVTTDEGLETLAVSELQIQHPAVPIDQAKA
jgi:hypothetical protein